MKKLSVSLTVIVLFLLLVIVVPVSGAAICTAPAQCLTGQQAAEIFGPGNYTQTSPDSCGQLSGAAGFGTPQYCFVRSSVSRSSVPFVAVTTTPAILPVRGVPTQTTQAPSGPGLIAPSGTTQQTPVPTTSPGLPVYTTPPLTIAPAKPTTEPTPFPAMTGSQQGSEFSGIAKPLIITAGSHHFAPLLGAGSPYYPSQVIDPATMPTIFLETDRIDNQDHSYFSPENPAYPAWSDSAKLVIGKDEKYHDGNFRYLSSLKNAKSVLFQVSRYPFANDPAHWQNQYIPGLIASGEAKVYHTDDEGYNYFRINFARVAQQNPGDPPYYVGTVPYEPGQYGQGKVLDVVDIPFTSTGIVLKKVTLGGVSLPFPSSVFSVSQGELTQGQLGYPNKNMTLSCTDCLQMRSPGILEISLLDADQRFYVRVVPIHDGGVAGVPAIPVEVTVSRPHPCTPSTSDVTVKLPSSTVVWYMKPTFGEYANHWYYPWGPPYGDEFVPQGTHRYEPPPKDDSKTWYETLIDTFNDAKNFFSWVVTQYSQLWNFMQDVVVQYVGDALTIGWCSNHSECTTVLKTALQAAMTASGIPPTLPTGPELMDLSTEYMVKLGVDELGAGELYDAYQSLPQEGKDALKELRGKAQNNAEKLTQSSTDQRYAESLKYRCFFDPKFTCTKKIPDPIFSSIHPATVMVWVNNPAQNPGTTDRVFITVSDSWHLYSTEKRLVPPLAPGEGVSIPVVLYEDYNQFKKSNGGPCDPNAPVSTYGGSQGSSSYENLSTCLQGVWQGRFQQSGEDTFVLTFSKGSELSGLDANSNGKPLSSLILTDGSCPSAHTLKFPQGWSVATPSYSINPASWDYFFDNGKGKSKTDGMLRNKP